MFLLLLLKIVTQILEKTISQPGKVAKELIENFLICISKNMVFTLILTLMLSLFQFLGITFLGIGLWAWNEKVS